MLTALQKVQLKSLRRTILLVVGEDRLPDVADLQIEHALCAGRYETCVVWGEVGFRELVNHWTQCRRPIQLHVNQQYCADGSSVKRFEDAISLLRAAWGVQPLLELATKCEFTAQFAVDRVATLLRWYVDRIDSETLQLAASMKNITQRVTEARDAPYLVDCSWVNLMARKELRRRAGTSLGRDANEPQATPTSGIDKLLCSVIEYNGTSLRLKPGEYPEIHGNGEIRRLDENILTKELIKSLIRPTMHDGVKSIFNERGAVSWVYTIEFGRYWFELDAAKLQGDLVVTAEWLSEGKIRAFQLNKIDESRYPLSDEKVPILWGVK